MKAIGCYQRIHDPPATAVLNWPTPMKRHGISRLPQVKDEGAAKRKFKAYPIGYFHIDIAELRTAEGKLYLFVVIDRTSKFAFVTLYEKADRPTAVRFWKR
jgi:hypothetical protein